MLIHCLHTGRSRASGVRPVSYTHLRAHETRGNLVCRLLLEKKIKNLAYLCGDVVSYDLDKDLKLSGFKVKKIINYTSSKITDLNSESLDLIKKYTPDVTLIYSKRSAESFDEIARKYSLSELMTQCTVMCLSLIHI